MRGKKDATTFPDKPVSRIASLFRGLMTLCDLLSSVTCIAGDH